MRDNRLSEEISFWEEAGEGSLADAQRKLERGDFKSPLERWRVRRWIAAARRRQAKEWGRTQEGAAVRQADAAEAASRWAAFAVVISVFALALSAWPYLREILAN